MCLALASARVSALEDYPSLLQNLAHRRYLGAITHCLAPSFASTPQKRSSIERGHSGFSVGKDYRSRRGSSRCSMVLRSCSRAFLTSCGWMCWLYRGEEKGRGWVEKVL